jgi:hypothetical protein
MPEDQRVHFQTKPAEGLRLSYHLFPTAQRGGLSFYPVSGVVNGCRISNPELVEKDSVSSGNPAYSYVAFELSEGDIKLDGWINHVFEFSGADNKVLIPLPSEFNDLSLGESGDDNYRLIVPVFINPRREVPVVQELPSASGYSEGDKVVRVMPHSQFDEYLVVRDFYKKRNGDWVKFSNDIVFESPVEGKDWGHNNLPFNAVKESDIRSGDSDTLTTSDSNSLSNVNPEDMVIGRVPEKKVFHKSVSPPYVSGKSQAYLRESATLFLAEIHFDVAITGGSFDSSSTEAVKVDQRYSRTRLSI